MNGFGTSISAGTPVQLRLKGELDMAAAPKFEAIFRELSESEGDIVIDLAEITFVDSTGFRTLVTISRSRTGYGPLKVVNAPNVMRIARIIAVDCYPPSFRLLAERLQAGSQRDAGHWLGVVM
jgi:anti-anti-sigma factor